MSMPKLPEPNPDLTQEQALAMILSSIALEEAALAHIMNAEGEKIQYALNEARCGDCSIGFSNIVEVNRSVTDLLEMVQQNQAILKSKMEKVLEYLPKSAAPPKPLPCPPKSDCATPDGMPVCFCAIPKTYGCDEPLLWFRKHICCDTTTRPRGSSKTRLSTAEPVLLSFYAETDGAGDCRDALEMFIGGKGMKPIRIKMAPRKWEGRLGYFKKTIIEIPCSCTACYASVFVRAPQGMHIKRAGFCFTGFRADVLRATEQK